MRSKQLVGAFVLLLAGVILLQVGPALAGWTQRNVKELPPKTASFTVTALSCNDQTSHPLQTNTVQIEAWNTSTARIVCLAWTGTPDHTDLTSCDVVLGAYAGSGSSDIYQSPSTLGLSGITFQCDADGATVIRVTEFVGPSAY